jgi:YgiT-type zinc finger domain-containing protein
MKSSTQKSFSCPLCKATTFKRKMTPYPVQTADGRQINIGRVAVQECENCHHLIPTKSGYEKINRCLETMALLFLGK